MSFNPAVSPLAVIDRDWLSDLAYPNMPTYRVFKKLTVILEYNNLYNHRRLNL